MPVYSFQLSQALAGNSVSVRAVGSSNVVASGTLDEDAAFTASLPAGDYEATAAGGHYSYKASGTVAKGDPDAILTEESAAAMLQASQATSASTLTIGPTRVLPGIDTNYAAFPSISRTDDGRIIMVWYQATDHLTTRDGNIMASYSTDLGRTWSASTAIVNDATDLRDPVVRLIGGKLYLTYCRGSAANAWEGSLLRVSSDNGATWGPEIRIDGGQEYASITAPVVDLGGGTLLAAWNAKALLSHAYASAWTATSTDGGATWSAPRKVVDGIALGFNVYEPWVSRRGNTLVMTYRVNERQDLGRVVSTDNGATWSAHQTILTGANGRPATCWLSDGTLTMTHRNLVANGADSGLIRYSRDNGAKWSPGKVIESAEPYMWVYSDMLEVYPGVVLVATATEKSSTSARLSLRYATMGGAVTPFGDIPADRRLAVAADTRSFAVADDFDRPDSTSLGFAPTGQEWSATSGLALTTGTIHMPDDGSSGVFRYATVDPRCQQVDIEADVMWQGNAGLGLVLRYVDASNHLFVASETNGTNLRLYQRTSGTATQLATAGAAMSAGTYHRLRVLDNGGVIRVYLEGVQVFSHTLAASTTGRVGFQGVSGNGAAHRCRRFTVARRSTVV